MRQPLRQRLGASYEAVSTSLKGAGYRAVLVFLLALAPRLPGLRLFLTTDEPFFVQRAADVIAAFLRGDFQGTYWHFYPGVTMNWLDGLGLGVQWTFARLTGARTQPFDAYLHGNILDLIVATRLPYALLTAASVAGFYLLVRRLLGHRTALLGALFIAFDPFFLAHSRVTHGDALVAVFMGLSALAFFVYLKTEEKRRRWLVLSAAMGGLAALTKAPGQLMAPFVVLVGIGDWLFMSWHSGRLDWRLVRRWLVDLALWGCVAVFLFVALWPALWVDPVGVVARMLDETFGKVEAGHLVFFMGQPTLDPGLWFYPYVILFRLTPVTLIGLFMSGAVVVGRLGGLMQGRNPFSLSLSWRSGQGKRVSTEPVAAGGLGKKAEEAMPPGRAGAAALIWLFVVTLLLFGVLSPKKQDRYLLPLFPCLDILAALALVEIGEWVNRRISESTSQRIGKSTNQQINETANQPVRNTQHAIRIAHYVLRFTFLILLAVHVFPTLTAYPYYLAYFNPLMGGLPRAVETTLVGWGEGMEQAAAYLNQRPDAERLFVAAVPAQTLLPYFQGTGENFYTNDVALRADYVVLYVSQVQRLAPSPEIVRYFRAMKPEHTVYVRGVPFAWVYPGPKLIATDVPPEATLANVGLGDQLRLAGYQISNVKYQMPNIKIVLYWHALATMNTDYTVSVRLVGRDGAWLAQRDGRPAGGLLPTSQWRPGDYVQDVHTLEVPSGQTVDRVQVVVYDAASGQPLGAPIELPVDR